MLPLYSAKGAKASKEVTKSYTRGK